MISGALESIVVETYEGFFRGTEINRLRRLECPADVNGLDSI